MKNVTISMDDELALETRIAAARDGKSVSRFLAEAAREKLGRSRDDEARNTRLEAIQRFLSGPSLPISENGRMPTADERNGGDE